MDTTRANTRVDSASRATGGKGDLPQGGTGPKARATGSRLQSVPEFDPTKQTGMHASEAGYAIVHGDAPLEPLKRAGFEFELVHVKSPKSRGARFQVWVSGMENEWKVTSPSGVSADLDAIAIDPTPPHAFVAVEAKATFVVEPDKSAHLIFYEDKFDELSRQLVICLESNGRMRMEIVVNAVPAGEIYLHVTREQLAQALRKDFGAQVRAFASREKGQPVLRIALDKVEKIIEDNVTVVVAEWATRGQAKKK